MKNIFFVLLIVCICQVSIAQNILTGKVTDRKTGEAVTGATVYIPELKTGDIADNNGVYKIVKLPKTTVTVQVSFLGYKSIVEKLTCHQQLTVILSLIRLLQKSMRL